MPDLADHAYALACAVLGPGDAAAEVAATALRRGGRVRSAVLGHARDETLQRASEATSVELDADAPADLSELAAALATARPPIERIIVDLDTRHALDRGGFARALGLASATAGARAATVAAEWQNLLDPVVLAHLGAGDCEGLAAILPFGAADGPLGDDAGGTAPAPATMRQLLDLGPSVADHAAGCAACGDRLRSMVSVRTLLGQRKLEQAPTSVRLSASASSRLRRATAPPPLEPEGPGRRWLRPVAIAAAAVLAAAIVGGIVSALRHRPDDEARQVEALIRIPVAGTSLTVDRAALEGTTPPPVMLANLTDRTVGWAASADATWLLVTPSEGTLEPGARIKLRIGVTPDAPEGSLRGAVRISGNDGSATLVRLSATVERPPEVVATATGCDIAATVEDESEVRAVELHWVEGTASERIIPLPSGAAGYSGRLPNGRAAMVWWVTASDARGNTARTPSENLAAGTCP